MPTVAALLGGAVSRAHIGGMTSPENIPTVFDRRAVRLHRDRAAATVPAVADVLRDAAERLLDRLDDTQRQAVQARAAAIRRGEVGAAQPAGVHG